MSMRFTRCTTMAVVLLLTSASAFAVDRNNNRNNNNNSNNRNYNTPAAVDHSASRKAGEDLRVAQTELTKANGAHMAAIETLKKEFENSADFKAAAEALKAAELELEAARKPILEGLKTRPEYSQALLARQRAQDEKDRVMEDQASTPEQRMAAAETAMNTGNIVSRMEAEVLAADPACSAARGKLTAAGQRITALRKGFEDSIKNNATLQAAKQTVDAARQKVDTAKNALAEAVRREAEQERQRQQQIAEQRRQWADQQNRNNNNNNNNNNNRNNNRNNRRTQ